MPLLLKGVGRRILVIFKYSLGSVIVGGTAIVLHRNNYDVSSIGAVRLIRAGFTAARIFVDYKWSLQGLDGNEKSYAKIMKEAHQRSAEKLLALACSNGGCWIKVGQHIGALEYLLPEEYTKTLSILHSRAPESSLTDMERVFREDLGLTFSDAFDGFEPKPIGAASLAQVYRARRSTDGSIVAIKIQHPRVKPHSFVDITTMEILVNIAAKLFPDFKLLWLAEEMKKNLPLELDFLHEGNNAERVRRMFSHLSFLKVPYIVWDLSSARVLTMEYCEGGQVNDSRYLKEHGISPYKVCRQLGQLYSEMIFVQGYVHCDPHPGNVLVHSHQRHGVQIVLLDHGLYTTLSDEFRLNYANFWLNIINVNIERMKLYADKLGVGDLAPLFACMVTARSWNSLTHGIENREVTEEETNEIKVNVANYLPQISQILNRVPRQMILIFKTNDLLRGIEWNLGTINNAYAFLYMSKCCARAVRDYTIHHAASQSTRMRARLAFYWTMFGLNLYELWRRLVSSLSSLVGMLRM